MIISSLLGGTLEQCLDVKAKGQMGKEETGLIQNCTQMDAHMNTHA